MFLQGTNVPENYMKMKNNGPGVSTVPPAQIRQWKVIHLFTFSFSERSTYAVSSRFTHFVVGIHQKEECMSWYSRPVVGEEFMDTNAIEMFPRPVELRPAHEVQLPVLEHIQRILGDRTPCDLV